MKKKSKIKIILIGLIVLVLITATSFALWQITLQQTEKNIITAGCFKIELSEENDIELEKAYPITDEEGKKLSPYTFTITNTCESFASFQINLEILNTSTLENLDYMKIMLEDKISILTSNEETTKTLENATKSYKLQTGYLRENQSKTFQLKLWMDYDTPPRDEFMNKVFKSKVTIISNYKNNLDNNIIAEGTSLNEKYQDSETFSLHVTSENYDIVSISEDLENWEELETKGRDITIEKTVISNGEHIYYFMDEAENVKEISVTASKIDDQKPISNMTVTKTNNIVSIDASTSKDNETRIVKYYYSKDGTNYEESESNTYQFTNEYEYGIATTMLTNYERNQIKKIYLKTEDEVGNISEIKEIDITDSDFAYDGTTDNNLRYIGANPNNYVSFNNELWRIIGVMNNVDDGTGKIETRIKLIRNESIGEYSWDTSDSTVNSGWGVNEWSKSDLMKLLNPEYDNNKDLDSLGNIAIVNNSLYWDRESGTCYNGSSNTTTTCNFTSIGLTSDSKKLIKETVWHLGSNGTTSYDNILTSRFYELERSENIGKICTNSSLCNDTVIRTTFWKGFIGLMYPSDYGFATNGGNTTNRETCLNIALNNWKNIIVSDCKDHNWLYHPNASYWTISPDATTSDAHSVFDVIQDGSVGFGHVHATPAVYPSLYLKSNVKILDDGSDGSMEKPFHLDLLINVKFCQIKIL